MSDAIQVEHRQHTADGTFAALCRQAVWRVAALPYGLWRARAALRLWRSREHVMHLEPLHDLATEPNGFRSLGGIRNSCCAPRSSPAASG